MRGGAGGWCVCDADWPFVNPPIDPNKQPTSTERPTKPTNPPNPPNPPEQYPIIGKLTGKALAETAGQKQQQAGAAASTRVGADQAAAAVFGR